MFWWLIIAIIVYFALRAVWIFISLLFEVWAEYKRIPPELDIEALHQELQDKTEAELWEMRNEYHGYLVEALNTPSYRFFLDIIGEIDKQIYFLRDQKKRGLS